MKIVLLFHSLSNDKILNMTKLEADNKMKVTEKMKFILKMLENIVGKGENGGYQHFLFFPQYFSKGLILKVV